MRGSYRARRGVHRLAAAICTLGLGCAGAPEPLTAESVAGADPGLGAELFERLSCAACHADPEARHHAGEGPALDAVGARLRPEWLQDYLAGRTASHPTELALRPEDAQDLLHFLLAQGTPPAADTSAPLEEVEAGRQLYHGVGCVACHDPLEHAEDLEAPLWSFTGGFEEGGGPPPQGALSLAHLPRKTTPAALAAQLLDPRAVHPDGRMPALRLDAAEAARIAAYLCAEAVHGGRLEVRSQPGLAYEYVEYDGVIEDSRAAFDARLPVRRGVAEQIDGVPEHREEMVGFRFRGFVEVPVDGEWTFYLASDDGSRLWIDGEIMVDHGGDHSFEEKRGTRRLAAGAHVIELTYYERTGVQGLTLAWSGPDVAREIVPALVLSHRDVPLVPTQDFTFGRTRIVRGATRFDALGCGACHPLFGRSHGRGGPALRGLDVMADDGCLGPRPARGTPRYSLAPMERAALARHLAEPPNRLGRDLDELGCLACHVRDGAGGPTAERAAYFHTLDDADLGNEGRLPPHLDGVGAKLTEKALERTLLDAHRPPVRPYLRVRMPDYGSEQIAHLPALLRAADAPKKPLPAPRFSVAAAEQGRRLAGAGQLGCIQCHDLGAYPSLGIRAVNLAEVHGRIEPDWFRRLMLDPRSVGMNSRMPVFWSDAKSPIADVLDGDPARQTDALWSWLSLGAGMPLPDGLALPENEYELVPLERPILCGVFMQDVGPRTLVVGFPERLHYAYDMAGARVAKVWRGRFFDARGTWHARAGVLEKPPSDDVLELAPGPPFAVLASEDEPWPSATERCKPLGRRMDARGVPTHRFALGETQFEERPEPVLAEDGARLVRHLVIRNASAGLNMRVAEASTIEALGDGAWRADAAQFHLRLPPDATARVRTIGTRQELVVALPTGVLELEVEIAW